MYLVDTHRGDGPEVAIDFDEIDPASAKALHLYDDENAHVHP